MANGVCNTILDYPTANGAMPLLYSIRDCVPYAFAGLLLVIFLILFAGNYFLVKGKTGKSKVLVAFLGASFVMVLLSILLAMTQLVTFIAVLFWAFLCIVAFILFLLSDNT